MNNLAHAQLAVVMLDLHLPGAASLKAKRQILTSLKERIKHKFNVSVAEIGEMDKHQRSVCGVAMIANDRRFLDSSVQSILSFIRTIDAVSVIDSETEIF